MLEKYTLKLKAMNLIHQRILKEILKPIKEWLKFQVLDEGDFKIIFLYLAKN